MFVRLLFATTLVVSVSACTSTKLAGSIEGEPVCKDFELSGGNMMKGSLRFPVKVTITDDGDDSLWERLVFGRRKADDKSTVFAIADSDDEYLVRWAQCPNPFAPKPVEAAAKTTNRVGGYTCGEAKQYAETKLTVRAGDAASRVLQWQTPPEADCWTTDAPNLATSASASASVPTPAPTPPPEPSAAPSAESSAEPATSVSAATSASPAPSAKPPKAPEKKPTP